MIDDPTLLRALSLWLPVLVIGARALVLGLRPSEKIILIMALAWQLPLLFVLNELAHYFGWWQFRAEGGLLFHVPFDLILGWALLWTIPALWRGLTILMAFVFCFAFDLVVMPRMTAVLVLGEDWLFGETLALGLILIPFLLFSRLIATRGRLAWRALFYGLSYGGVFFILLPSVVLDAVGDNWLPAIDPSLMSSVWRSSFILWLLPGISAAMEFERRGQGTPLPFDPPTRLVRTGLYAYVANPMQISCFMAYVFLGLLLRNYWICCGALGGWIWSMGMARSEEKTSMESRFQEAWLEYRRSVRLWLPRARPFVPREQGTASLPHPVLYVAGNCKKCQSVRAFLEAREPLGLVIEDAELHPSRDLYRLTYDPGDGSGDEEGVAAFMRALDHISLPYALVSALVRTPGLIQVIQWLVDAAGAGPMLVRREPHDGPKS